MAEEKKRAKFDLVIGSETSQGVREHALYLILKRSKDEYTVTDGTAKIIAPISLFTDPSEEDVKSIVKDYNSVAYVDFEAKEDDGTQYESGYNVAMEMAIGIVESIVPVTNGMDALIDKYRGQLSGLESINDPSQRDQITLLKAIVDDLEGLDPWNSPDELPEVKIKEGNSSGLSEWCMLKIKDIGGIFYRTSKFAVSTKHKDDFTPHWLIQDDLPKGSVIIGWMYIPE